VALTAETFELPEPIWEIGSFLVEGQEEMADLRGLFCGREFVGLDMRAGPGVDRVENVEHLNCADHSAGTVLCLNTLEHVANVYSAVREMYRVLKPGGVLLMTTPFDFVIHDHPHDYWRFTPQALELLTKDYPTRLIGYQGYELMPHNTFVVAFKRECADELATRLPVFKMRFQEVVASGRMKLGFQLRMALARQLVGDRFFRTRRHWRDVEMWVVPTEGTGKSVPSGR
jgi:SAM-dependent methyltransferase